MTARQKLVRARVTPQRVRLTDDDKAKASHIARIMWTEVDKHGSHRGPTSVWLSQGRAVVDIELDHPPPEPTQALVEMADGRTTGVILFRPQSTSRGKARRNPSKALPKRRADGTFAPKRKTAKKRSRR